MEPGLVEVVERGLVLLVQLVDFGVAQSRIFIRRSQAQLILMPANAKGGGIWSHLRLQGERVQHFRFALLRLPLDCCLVIHDLQVTHVHFCFITNDFALLSHATFYAMIDSDTQEVT